MLYFPKIYYKMKRNRKIPFFIALFVQFADETLKNDKNRQKRCFDIENSY